MPEIWNAFSGNESYMGCNDARYELLMENQYDIVPPSKSTSKSAKSRLIPQADLRGLVHDRICHKANLKFWPLH
jgi:hypothetical protein